MRDSIKARLQLVLKGIGMGAADIVPGVSGGTIALITGIYEELIDSLKSFSTVLPFFKREGLKASWKHINGSFLITLFSGIAVSFLGLVQFIEYALEHQPILLWSFFFGLILASCYFVAKIIKKWSTATLILLISGALITYFITGISPAETPDSLWFVFISGMIAICAMILPGISGSFILLLLGKYKYMISALSNLDFTVIFTFMAGCVIGILSFSHLLSYLLKKYHDLTIAFLTGFMLGSLNKIWPWKITTKWDIDRHGVEIPILQDNVLPANFPGNPELIPAILMAIIGAGLIIILEVIAQKTENKSV